MPASSVRAASQVCGAANSAKRGSVGQVGRGHLGGEAGEFLLAGCPGRGEEHVREGGPLGELLHQARLADPAATADQHGPARPACPPTRRARVEQVAELRQLVLPSHEPPIICFLHVTYFKVTFFHESYAAFYTA